MLTQRTASPVARSLPVIFVVSALFSLTPLPVFLPLQRPPESRSGNHPPDHVRSPDRSDVRCSDQYSFRFRDPSQKSSRSPAQSLPRLRPQQERRLRREKHLRLPHRSLCLLQVLLPPALLLRSSLLPRPLPFLLPEYRCRTGTGFSNNLYFPDAERQAPPALLPSLPPS